MAQIDKVSKIGTHNRLFHADEVTAIAMVKVFTGSNPTIIRTRDKDVLDGVLQEGGILIDVSGEYDPEKGIFDHHHSKDGVNGKASAGIIADALDITEERYPLLTSLIRDVDAQDLGIRRNPDFHYSNIIASHNVLADDYVDNDDAFEKALRFAVDYITALKKQDELNFFYKKEVEETTKKEIDGIKVAIRGKSKEFVPAVEFVGKADLVLSWDKLQECWSLQTVPLVKGDFKSKYKIVSVGNPVFVHPAGFIAKIEDTGDDIVLRVKGEDESKTIVIPYPEG